MTATAQLCARGAPGGPVCERTAEVTIHLLKSSTGVTERHELVCPVHAFEALGLAFMDVRRPERELMTVMVTPL